MTKYGLISDIHADYENLKKAMQELETHSVDEIICLGDVAEDKKSTNNCIDLLIANDVMTVLGNHDKLILRKGGTNLSKKILEYLRKCPKKIEVKDLVFVHDHPLGEEHRGTRRFFCEYIQMACQGKELLQLTPYRLIFVGHTHEPSIISEDKKIDILESGQYTLQKNKRYVLNPGPINNARDCGTTPCIGIFDSDKNIFEVHRPKTKASELIFEFLGAELEPIQNSKYSAKNPD